jgi:hypothetical protein
VPGRDEGQLGTVRAPGHVLGVGVPGGDLDRLRQGCGVVREVRRQLEEEQLAPAVAEEPDVVQPVLQGGDQPRRLGARRDALDGAVPARFRNAGGVREAAGVG